jgi:hypothetical protein
MTDINKAAVFLTECLQWELSTGLFSFSLDEETGETYLLLRDQKTERTFDPCNGAQIQERLDEFLAKRYLIQMHRGTSTLFKWTVIVGLQDKYVRGAHLGRASYGLRCLS